MNTSCLQSINLVNSGIATRSKSVRTSLVSRPALVPCKSRFTTVVRCQKEAKQVKVTKAASSSKDESSTPSILFSNAALSLLAAAEVAEPGYSQNSYNVTLGLFVLALPGLWSLVKRSTKSKIVQKTFVVPGPAVDGSESLSDLAKRISTFFKNNNYVIKEAGETIKFEGAIAASRGQAAALTFYAFVGLLCTALVLSIANASVGDKWYLITLLSPGAGYYYWTKAERKEQVEVKMVTSDDDSETEIRIQGDAEEVERFWKDLNLREKGMVFVEGLL